MRVKKNNKMVNKSFNTILVIIYFSALKLDKFNVIQKKTSKEHY